VVLAIVAAPGLAQAQKSGQESRPAVMQFGALDGGGQAAIGAGLRLFPSGAGQQPVMPSPVPTPAPQAAVLTAPAVKPAPAPQPVAASLGKPAPLPPQDANVAPHARPVAAAPPHGLAAAPRSATTFATDPAVSARVRQQVLATALPTSPDPQRLRQTVADGTPWLEFDRLLAQHGYDSRDLSDVVAAFYLIAWEVSTGGDATIQPAGIAAVRGQARQMLASMPSVANMTDAQRQETAETLAFHAIAMVGRHHDLQAAGAGPALAAYRNEVADAVSQHQGIDLRRFALTPAGFQTR
jgi:hypothetical protein